jgi:expansin (peptidoglycan-binding protein)
VIEASAIAATAAAAGPGASNAVAPTTGIKEVQKDGSTTATASEITGGAVISDPLA